MKIGIDARMMGKGYGIGRYIEQLVLNLKKIDQKNEYIFFVKDIQDHPNFQTPTSELQSSNFKFVSVNIPWYSLEEQLKFTKIIKKGYSLLDCTCESSGRTEHNSLCRHKQFFIILAFKELFKEKIEELINQYKGFAGIKVKADTRLFLDDLNKLKKLKEGKKV